MTKHAGVKVDGFIVRPMRVFIWVQEFGQPNCSPGGVYFGEVHGAKIGQESFTTYRANEWRYGRVIARGPGYYHNGNFIEMTEPELGDVVMYSRRHGTRMAIKHEGLWLRVLDPLQVIGVCEDFTPWWDVEECQLSPEGTMTG